MGVPKKIVDNQGVVWNYNPKISYRGELTYFTEDSPTGVMLKPSQIETNFTRIGRPEPISEIIKQGRWECGLASLAMIIQAPLWDVKRAASHCGWNNDDKGITNKQLLKTSKLLGREVYFTNEATINTPQLILLKSLNVEGSGHVVYWNGFETLDPNWGFPERKWWGCEWSPELIDENNLVLVLAESGCARTEEIEDSKSLEESQKIIADYLCLKTYTKK
jgi:hypothetical protein